MAADTPLVPGDEQKDPQKKADASGGPYAEKQSSSLDNPETERLMQNSGGGGEQANGDSEAAKAPEGGTGVDLNAPASKESLAAGKGIGILSKGVARFTSKNKRGLAVGGGLAGIIILIFMGVLALLPLKLENMVKNIIEKRFARLEFAMEKRAEKHVEFYLEKQIRAKAEGTGTTVIATGNLASDLYSNWQANRFEDQIEKDMGVKIEYHKSDKSYSILQGIGGKDEIFHGSDLDHIGNNEFRSKLNDIIKQDTKWNQVYKRHHTRKILTLKFGVKKYWVFPKTREAAAGKVYDAKQALKHELVSRVVEPVSAKYATYFHCIIDGCSEQELRDKLGENAIPPGSGDSIDENAPGVHDPNTTDPKQHDSNSQADQAAINNAEATNVAQEATQQVEQQIADESSKNAEALAGEGIIKELQTLMENQIVKAIGAGIGVMEFISKLDSAIQHDTFGRIVASKNSLQYANEFAAFATISDQIKSGQVTGDEVSAVMDQVGDYGSSKPYQRAAGLDPSGQVLQCTSDPNNTTTADVCPDKLVGSNDVSDVTNTIKNSPFFAPIHAIAVAYRDSIGGIYGAIQSVTNGVLDDIVGPILDAAISALKSITGIDLNKWLADGFDKVLGFFFGPILSGNETGPDLYNAVDAGADVTANAEMQSAGAAQVPPGKTSHMDPEVLQEKIADANREGLWARLASLDDTNSVASNLIVAFVMTPRQLMGKISTTFLAFAMSPFKTVADSMPRFALATTSPSYAAAEEQDPYGIQQYDFSDSTLNMAVDQVQRIDGKGSCPADENDPYYQSRANETQDDPCRLELLTIQSLNSVNNSNNDGSIQ